jgi:threonine dehydratase
MNDLTVCFDDVLAARERIQSVAHNTPVMTSRTANALTGSELFFKCENLQRVGAFKFRGAYNALSQFTPEQRKNGVIAYSSGNHAQAVAFAARLLNVRAVIVMPTDAPAIKLDATRGYGAEVVLYDRYTEDREEIGRRLAGEQGLTLIPPYDHPHVIAGQGSLALEFFEEAVPLDVLVAPVGGGGLLSGCAIAAKAINPSCAVIGVEPEAGNDAQRSLQSGEIVHIDIPHTIADGAHTFPILRRCVERIVTVSDAQLVEAMAFFASRMKMLVEPTGCLAAAAVFNGVIPVEGKRVGVVLSGGNVDLARFLNLVAGSQ